MSSRASFLLAGASWTYGAQIATVLVQLGYAAITSRALSPQAFGAYGIALTAVGIFTVVASGGLSQSVARLQAVNSGAIAPLFTYAILLGGVTGIVTFASASWVAALWGTPESADVIRVLALSASIAPVLGVSAGILRRLGLFRRLAFATFICNLAGMGMGLLVIELRPSPSALAIAAVAGQSLTCITALVWTRHVLGLSSIGSAFASASFSMNVSALSVSQYFSGNLVRFTTANHLGATNMGHWNRAEVLSSLPFQQLQAALIPVLYPEFRHDHPGASRTQRVWTDMLLLLAWVTFPLGIAGAAVLPLVTPLILGDQWSDSAAMTIPLALAGGLQPVAVLLAGAIESLARFRVTWTTQAFVFAAQVAVAIAVYVTSSPILAVSSIFLANIVLHIVLGVYAHKTSLLDGSRLIRGYVEIILLSSSIVLAGRLVVEPFGIGSRPLTIAGAVTLAAAALGWTLQRRSRLTPIALARRYLSATDSP